MFCLVALFPLALGQSLWLGAWLLGMGPAGPWEGASCELCPEQVRCGVQGGLGPTDGLEDERVCSRGLPVQAYHCPHNGIAVANTELPIHISTCGQERMKVQSGNGSWPGKGRWHLTLLLTWDTPGVCQQ